MQEAQNNSKRWWALTAVCIAIFMALLDVTVVNVALPTIQKSFNDTFDQLQWIVNAYTLMYAISLLLISKLGDIFGRKLMFILCLSLFTVGSLAGSMAPNDSLLILFRGIQGIGGSGMMSLSMSIVATMFQGRERGLALGIWSSVAGLSTASGPLVGGLLVQYFSWRAIFLVNVPIGIIAIIMSILFIIKSKHEEHVKIDWIGMIVSTLMVFCFIFGLIQKENHVSYSWTNWHVASLLIAGALLLIFFIWVEHKLTSPMIDLSIFRSTSFIGTCIASFVLGGGMYAFYTYLTVLMQNYMGYTALQTGFRQMLISSFSLVLGPITGSLTNRIRPRYLITGALLLMGGGMLSALLNLGYSSTWTVLILSFVLFGLGNALINPPISSTAIESVEPRHIGMASGVVNVFRQGGTSFGVVILGIMLTNTFNSKVTSGLSHIHNLPGAAKTGLQKGLFAAGPFSGNAVINSPQAKQLHQIPGLFDQVKTAVFHAYYQGMNSVIATSLTMFSIAAVLCFILVSIKPRTKA